MKYKITYKDGSSKIVDALNVQSVQNMFLKHSHIFQDLAQQVKKNDSEDNIKLLIQDAIRAELSMLNILQKL